MSSSTGAITGKPTVPQAATTYTITGTGATSGSATTAVTITVLTPTITPASQTVSGTVGKTITATSSLVGTGLSGTISYAISPTLPAGLLFNTSRGSISGTPTVVSPTTIYTITGTGATGGSATAQITIGVVPPPPAISPLNQTLTGVMNKAIRSTQTLTATNFTGPVTYSISPALSAGLAMSTTTGVISGTPTIDQALTTYTIAGTDGTSSATSTITVTISLPPASITPSSQSVIGPVGTAITPTTAYIASYFGGTVSYTISPALPANLSMDPATGVISGTPTATQAATSYTITATGSTSGTATARVSISVPPAAISPATQTVNGTINAAINSTRAYTANYFSGAVTYVISPGVTNGLNFDTSTGILSGTSTAILLPTTYTVTATGAVSGLASATITVTVSPTISPTSQTINWPVNAPIKPTTAFTPVGFTGTIIYSVSPSLPTGLNIDPTTGIITGTATTPQAATRYVITATDAVSGSVASALSITITNPPNCLPATLTSAEEGRRAYLRLNCYSCHGDTGLGGMGPNIQGESGGVTDAVPNGAEGGMPAFANYLCANDLTYLQAYLNSLGRTVDPKLKFKHWWEQTPSQ